MLIERKPSVGDIVTIRLMSGDEVVGRLATSSEQNTTKLQKPIAVGMRMLPNNQASLSFLPILVSTDESASVTFQNASITVMPILTRKDVADQYVMSTTDLEVPQSGLFIPQ